MVYRKVTKYVMEMIVLTLVFILLTLVNNNSMTMQIIADVQNEIEWEVFYTIPNNIFEGYISDMNTKLTPSFIAENSVKSEGESESIKFNIPTKDIGLLRIDFGSNPGDIELKTIIIKDGLKKLELVGEECLKIFTEAINIEVMSSNPQNAKLYSNHKDPRITMSYKYDYNNLLKDYGVIDFWIILKAVCFASVLIVIIHNITRRLKYKYYSIFIAVFMLIIIVPYIASSAGVTIVANSENTSAKEKPNFVLNEVNIGDYISRYEECFDKSYGLRDLFIRINNYLQVKYLKDSPIEKVALGKDKWLFFSGDDHKSLLEYRGIERYTQQQLEMIVANLEEVKEYLSSKNSEFVLFIAPNKESIYSELLSDSIKIANEEGKLDQLIEYIQANSDIHIIDIRQELIDAKPLGELYFRTDTHWNELGAYIAYTKVMNELQQYDPRISEPKQLDEFSINIYGFDTGGDLSAMLSLQDQYEDTYIKLELNSQYTATNPKTINYMGADLSVVDSFNTNKNLPKFMMFRDSFGANISPFLSEHFSRATYKRDYRIDAKLVEEVQPDVVMLELIERNTDRLMSKILER